MQFTLSTLLAASTPQGADADRNVMKLSEKFSEQPLVMCSALAECFLQKMKQQVRAALLSSVLAL